MPNESPARPLRATEASGAQRPGARSRRRERLAGYFYLSVGLAVAGLWLVSLPGAFEDGLLSYAGTESAGNIPVFHLIGEMAMALTALTAGWALVRGSRGGRVLALLASGMLIYSSINSSGWLLQHQPVVLVVTGVTLAGSIAAALMLARPAT